VAPRSWHSTHNPRIFDINQRGSEPFPGLLLESWTFANCWCAKSVGTLIDSGIEQYLAVGVDNSGMDLSHLLPDSAFGSHRAPGCVLRTCHPPTALAAGSTAQGDPDSVFAANILTKYSASPSPTLRTKSGS